MNVTGQRLCGAPQGRRAAAHPAGGSRAEGPPVTHDRHEPVCLNTAQRGDNGAARHAVLVGQPRHRWQPLLRLPFALADSRAQRGLNPLAGQFGRAVGRHAAMIANTV